VQKLQDKVLASLDESEKFKQKWLFLGLYAIGHRI